MQLNEGLTRNFTEAAGRIFSAQKTEIEQLTQWKLEAIDRIATLETFSSEV